MCPPPLTVVISILIFCSSHASAQGTFSVQIVGAEQGEWTKFGEAPPIPFLDVPLVQVSDRSRLWDLPEPLHFYVLLRNISGKPITLKMLFSDWSSCLEFEITVPKGKSYHVCRPSGDWSRNFAVPWYFPPNGVKIFTIYFAPDVWEGLPSNKELPAETPLTIRAKFSYPAYARGKRDSSVETYSSAETAAIATR